MLSEKEKEEKLFKMLHRIYKSKDGKELIEYLESVSRGNYLQYKRCHPDRSEYHKGYANCIDGITTFFVTSKEKLEKLAKAEEPIPKNEDGSDVNAHA